MHKLTILLIMVFGFHFGAIAQTATQTPQEKIGKAVKKSYKSARKQMNRATHMMGEALGLEPKTTDPEPDDVKAERLLLYAYLRCESLPWHRPERVY